MFGSDQAAAKEETVGVKRAGPWAEIYYEAVEDYFWVPKLIGRRPLEVSSSWGELSEALRQREVPLNHILNMFFVLAPQAVLDAALSALVGAPVSGFELASKSRGLPELSRKAGVFTRPDFIFTNDVELLVVEMKLDTESGVDQFVKYAILAERFAELHPGLKAARLVLLAKTRDFARLWGDRGVADEDALRARALRGISGGGGIWKASGVQRYLQKASDAVRTRLCQRVKSMPLSVSTFTDLLDALTRQPGPDPTAAKLIDGLVKELKGRSLG